jgi:hypothetical protein
MSRDMDDIRDGGPAFPTEHTEEKILERGNGWHTSQQVQVHKPGMSLRDWFAGQALAGLLAATGRELGANQVHVVTAASYDMADEMLKARAEPVSADGLAEPSNASGPIPLGSIPGAVR